MSEFDPEATREMFVDALPASGTSTLTWNYDVWTASWRDEHGELRPGALGPEGGAWWFRALTEPERLERRLPPVSIEPLTLEEAGGRLAAFIVAANETLVHWPLTALAPIAFSLREALGEKTALEFLLQRVEPTPVLREFLLWLGPVSDETVATAVERLADRGELETADALASRLPTVEEAEWRLENGREIPVRLLSAAVRDATDDLFERLARGVVSRKEREIWDLLASRPLPTLVPRVLDRFRDLASPMIFDWFRFGGAEVVDALLDQALRRGRRAETALDVLTRLDRTTVERALARRDDEEHHELTRRIDDARLELPELPRSEHPGWLVRVAEREPRPVDWVDFDELGELVTRTGHRLPREATRGIVALLQEVVLQEQRYVRLDDQFDSSLANLHDFLTPELANSWWDALFAAWWTGDSRGDRWVLFAAAFLLHGRRLYDVRRKLVHHHKWFGEHGDAVVRAISRNESDWAIAMLDSLARDGRNGRHRSLAGQLLRSAAERAGRTTDAYVESNLPDEDDPVLIDVVAARLEAAMARLRTWTRWQWQKLVDEAAPFRSCAESVIWFADDPRFGGRQTFRLDGADLLGPEDEPVTVDDQSDVGVVHPAMLNDAEFDAWSEIFVDYEIVQPIEQLERDVYRAGSLSKDGFRSPIGREFAGYNLTQAAGELGWKLITKGAHGGIVGISKTYPEDVVAVLEFASALTNHGEGGSSFETFRFVTRRDQPLDPADISPATFSEIHRDVMHLTNTL